MTNPTTNQSSSAVDELDVLLPCDCTVADGRHYRGNTCPALYRERLTPIITAQEQRLAVLERDADYKSTLHDLVAERDALQAKIEQQEQTLDWTRQERDKYDLMSIKLGDERDALQEKVEQQEQRIRELEAELKELRHVMSPMQNPISDTKWGSK